MIQMNHLFISQLAQRIFESIYNLNAGQHSLLTEDNNTVPIEIPQALCQNNNDEILNNSLRNVGLISQNNIQTIEAVNSISKNDLFSTSIK